jgi:hypothetical protein
MRAQLELQLPPADGADVDHVIAGKDMLLDHRRSRLLCSAWRFPFPFQAQQAAFGHICEQHWRSPVDALPPA